MSDLKEYLAQKRRAALAKMEAARANPAKTQVKAQVRVAGRSGMREIRIRDFQIVSDSPPDFAGYNLGPGSPEMQMGVLGSCMTHITLIQAALRGVSLEAVSVEVTAENDPRALFPDSDDVVIVPHNIRYVLNIVSDEPPEVIAALHEAVEKACPILNLLANPQVITGEVVHRKPGE
ncbi:OsmC family protein [Acetobacteraceae bacterium H6797]|nr:OsmC family protein [Acetobacteraceae bacterium H6797]